MNKGEPRLQAEQRSGVGWRAPLTPAKTIPKTLSSVFDPARWGQRAPPFRARFIEGKLVRLHVSGLAAAHLLHATRMKRDRASTGAATCPVVAATVSVRSWAILRITPPAQKS